MSGDNWDFFNKQYFPNSDKTNSVRQPTKKRRGLHEYTETDMWETKEKLMAIFEKFNLTRSGEYLRINNKISALETKYERVNVKVQRYALHIEQQYRTIQSQRRAIRDRETDIQSQRQLLERYCCCVCMARDKDTAFNCGHMFCQECAEKTLQSVEIGGPTCPICRIKVNKAMKVNY